MPNYRRIFIPNSYVFLTIITHNRQPILIKNIDLSREAFRNVRNFYAFEIVACVILPEHLHIILYPKNINEYPKIVSAIKHYFSLNLDIKVSNLTESKIKKRERGIWHRRYLENTIINENDLNRHIDYIHYNPVKHGLIASVKDWQYSTFHKFVDKNMYDLHWTSIEDLESFACKYED